MVRYKIDSSLGGLWVTLLAALTVFFEWVAYGSKKNRPSPLKSFTASPSLNKGNAT